MPDASILNTTVKGQTRAAFAIVPVSANGNIKVMPFMATDLIVDVLGYFTGSSAASSASGLFVPVAPSRLKDTRGGAAIAANGSISVPYATSGVAALTGNVTAINARSAGFVTSYPSGQPVPNTSTVNVTLGSTVANGAIISTGPNGISFYSYGATDLAFDMSGYFTA
jgi:hypothetical protein